MYSDDRCCRHDVSTATILFYLIEMDTALGDPQYAIYGMLPDSNFVSNYTYVQLDQETAIMYRLQEVVLEQTDAILAVMEISAELDW